MAETLNRQPNAGPSNKVQSKYRLTPNIYVNNPSSKDMTISLVLANPAMPSSDLPLRHPKPPCCKEQRKPSFRQRFWALAGANNFGPGGAAPGEQAAKNEVKRMIYVPKHAASDFSAMSPGPLRTSLSSQNPKSRSGSSRSSLRTTSSCTTPATVESGRQRRLSSSSEPADAKECQSSQPKLSTRTESLRSPHKHTLKRSMSNISAPLPFTQSTAHDPLPATPKDFALFAAQARSNERSARPTEAAAAWSTLVQLQNAQRRSLDTLTSERRARPLSVAYSDGSISARHSMAQGRTTIVRRIQIQHAQQTAQAQRGLGHRIAAYIRPPQH